jgi:erythromycin esterase-like protein
VKYSFNTLWVVLFLTSNALAQTTSTTDAVVRLSPIDLESGNLQPSDKELAPLLKRLFDKTDILALGENVHDSETITQMIHRLIRYGVEKENVRNLVFEYSFFPAQELNQYLETGDGEITNLVEQAAWVASKDTISMMQWLRAFNQKHPNDKVRISAADIYDFDGMEHSWFLKQIQGSSILSRVEALSKRTSSVCIGHGLNAKEYDELMDDYRNGTLVDKLKLNQCLEILDKIADSVLHAQSEITKLRGSKTFLQLKIYVRNLKAQQWQIYNRITYRSDQARTWDYRDQAMADNVLDQWAIGGYQKTIFIAHTSHVAKSSSQFVPDSGELTPAGVHLYKQLGSRYKVIGFTGYNTDTAGKEYLKPTSKESLDLTLHNLRYQIGWMNMTKGSKKYDREWWLQAENDTEDAFPNGVWMNPVENYDALIFIDRSPASELIDVPVSAPYRELIGPRN